MTVGFSMYFKDVARGYGLTDADMKSMGDTNIWKFIIMTQRSMAL